MRDWLFRKATYNVLGGIIGYGIAPLSIASLGLPIYLRLPEKTRGVLGIAFFMLAVVATLCNVYLICHRTLQGHGASIFPLIVSATGVSALFLMLSSLGYWLAPIAVLILVFDFLGQGLLAGWICSFFTASKEIKPDQ